MSALRSIIDEAVGQAISDHPKYFTPKGVEKARNAIVRKIMAAFREDGEKSEAEPVAEQPKPFEAAVDGSRECLGYLNLRKLAGAVAPPRMSDGSLLVPAAAWCEAVFALAELPPQSEWVFVSARPQMGAWFDFFREKLPEVPRRAIAIERDGENGILMPWAFPPSKTGKIYDGDVTEQ